VPQALNLSVVFYFRLPLESIKELGSALGNPKKIQIFLGKNLLKNIFKTLKTKPKKTLIKAPKTSLKRTLKTTLKKPLKQTLRKPQKTLNKYPKKP
jgi:hypothetical protein